MKAAVRHEYGPPAVVGFEEIPTPTPGDDEVLVQVRAVSVNSSDWEFLTGSPLYVRMWGLLKPKHKILGSDIAGRVEAVGKNVKRFQSGDDVFGDIIERWGGFAEYVCAPEKALMLKPPSMTFEQASAIPQAALIALQGLEKGQIKRGHKVLINGAGGGAGSFAVQIAISFGAEVTGVDSTSKLEMMRSLGADHVVDYTQEDFTRNGQRYDLVLDFVARRSVFDIKRALGPKGIYVLVGGSLPRLLQVLLLGPMVSMTGKRMGILAAKPNQDLSRMIELFEAGIVVPVIDRCYPLGEVPAALQYLGDGQARGKVVITV